MKIMVTGANGQLGRHLGQALAKSSCDYILLTRSDLDIRCQQSVFEIVASHSPDIILNAAAYTDVNSAETQPELAYDVNAKGAGFLAATAKSINAPIIHFSTDYVFSGEKQGSYCEEDSASPLNIYGQSKYAGELEVINANPRHIILRTSWVFSEHGINFYKSMRRLGQKCNEISVVTDQFGGPTYAGDLADAALNIAFRLQNSEHPKWGIYHYSGQPYVSWFEFAQEIFRHSRQISPTLIPINTEDYSAAVKRPHNSRLDCTKINKAFGITPSNWKYALKNLNR